MTAAKAGEIEPSSGSRESAEAVYETENLDGAESADGGEIESYCGFTSRYLADPHNATQSLAILAAAWEATFSSWQQAHLRSRHAVMQVQMILEAQADDLRKMRDRLARYMGKALELHPLAEWLPTGLRGPQVCRVLGMIGDPWRFPGRPCAEGHHMPSYHVGLCGARVKKGKDQEDAGFARCDAPIGKVRPGSGTRALWHYLGLHVVEGSMPKRKRGEQATWKPSGRTAVLMPQGIADQIVMRKISPWREIYDETKFRLERERGAGVVGEIDSNCGISGDAAARDIAIESGCGSSPLPPWRIHKIARTVAAKAFVADLLAEWKRSTDFPKAGIE